MGIFDPKVNVEISPERTIDVPQVSNVGGMEAATTAAQGLGNFAAALLGGLGGSGRSNASGTTSTQQNRVQFLKDYQRVQQVQWVHRICSANADVSCLGLNGLVTQ